MMNTTEEFVSGISAPVSPPQCRGFGTVVMKAMAERSLGGRVELE
jgi:hypothetical protein